MSQGESSERRIGGDNTVVKIRRITVCWLSLPLNSRRRKLGDTRRPPESDHPQIDLYSGVPRGCPSTRLTIVTTRLRALLQ